VPDLSSLHYVAEIIIVCPHIGDPGLERTGEQCKKGIPAFQLAIILGVIENLFVYVEHDAEIMNIDNMCMEAKR